MSKTNNQTESLDPLLRPAHLALALGLGEGAVINHIRDGRIPQPDLRGRCALKLWRLSTIRAWNPTVAAAIEPLLKNPAFPAAA